MVKENRKEEEVESKPAEALTPGEAHKKRTMKKDVVVFWHRLRSEGLNGPDYHEDPTTAPPGCLMPVADFARIEYPRGSGKSLIIRGAREIDDKHIIAYLIVKSKPSGRAVRKDALGGIVKAKAGVLLYNAKQVIANGFMSKEELDRAANHSEFPEWYVSPMAPAPNFSGMPETELDKWAHAANVPKYDVRANIYDKIKRLQQFIKSR